MKILFIHNRYRQPGGEDRAVELESSLLIEKGHTVNILFFDNQGITNGWLQKIITFKRSIYNPYSANTLRHTILEFKPDIIHVHNLFFVASPAILKEANRHRIPVVCTLHNYRHICCNALLLRNNKPCEICIKKKLPFSGIFHACYRKSVLASAMVTLSTGLPKLMNKWSLWVDQYIVLTGFAQMKFKDSSLGARPDQLQIKPNFVPDAGMGEKERQPFFLYAGRLSAEKGIAVLLEAFHEMPGTKILIAGEGPEKGKLMDDYKMADNIEFLGQRGQEELLQLMKKCLALIFPSIWYEGLPFVMLEALSTGTPIIASDIGAMPTLVKDGYNGLVFKTGSKEDLKEAVLRFMKNGAGMYQHARETYLNHFHPDIHYQSIMKIYDRSIRANNERRS